MFKLIVVHEFIVIVLFVDLLLHIIVWFTILLFSFTLHFVSFQSCIVVLVQLRTSPWGLAIKVCRFGLSINIIFSFGFLEFVYVFISLWFLFTDLYIASINAFGYTRLSIPWIV